MTTPTRQRGRPKSFHSKQAQNTIQSLDRAIDVLEFLSRSGGQTLSEIAASMGQSPATIYRVLSTFQAKGLVEADAMSQTWSVGPATFRIGSAFLRRTSVMERARPYMRMLMEETGETANLGIRSGAHVMFVSQVETHHSIRAFFPPGTLAPMHSSGIGKALLSRMSENDVRKLIPPSSLEQFTPSTLCTIEDLLSDLEQSRKRMYAFDDEERTEGMRCLAAPIENNQGDVIAGISISGPTSRISVAKSLEFGKLVAEAAIELSAALGAAARP